MWSLNKSSVSKASVTKLENDTVFALSQPGVHQGVGGRADHPPQGEVAEDDGDEGQEESDEVGHGLGEGALI